MDSTDLRNRSSGRISQEHSRCTDPCSCLCCLGDGPDWSRHLERVPILSGRESEVFYLIGSGFSNRAISSRMRVTERTVKAHVAHIMKKLDLESRLQIGLVALSYRQLMRERATT